VVLPSPHAKTLQSLVRTALRQISTLPHRQSSGSFLSSLPIARRYYMVE
jgi:hypothetical protein